MGRPLLILLDTHVIVWLAGQEHRLSSKAKTAIEEARQTEEGLAVSDFTLYELSTLYRKKQFTLAVSPETFLSEVEQRFIILPITSRICLGALSLPADYPKDPADRILGATALVEGLALVTADTKIRSSRVVPTIW
jgi:PIN domain nuclease of toxin-antitoxin system